MPNKEQLAALASCSFDGVPFGSADGLMDVLLVRLLNEGEEGGAIKSSTDVLSDQQQMMLMDVNVSAASVKAKKKQRKAAAKKKRYKYKQNKAAAKHKNKTPISISFPSTKKLSRLRLSNQIDCKCQIVLVPGQVSLHFLSCSLLWLRCCWRCPSHLRFVFGICPSSMHI